MFWLILFLLCTGLSAWRIACLLAAREAEPLSRIERWVWIAVFWLALWLGQGYALALGGRFRPADLVACSGLLLAIVLGLTRTLEPRVSRPSWLPGEGLRRHFGFSLHHAVPLETLLPLAVVGIATAYSVAALWVLPVSNHDALSYHFPKAAHLAVTGSFALHPSQDLRVTFFPGNYEMLAATFLAFLRSDTSTGLITSWSLLLLVAVSFTLFQRVWKSTPASAMALAVMLGSPVLFLHVTAHKNDILMGAVTLNALLWLGRYAVHGGAGSAVVGVVCMALAVGTKFHGLFLVLASVLLVWHAWRNAVWRPSPAAAVVQGAGALGIFLLLGGLQYVANVASTGHLTGILQIPTPNAMNTVAYPAYWQVPRFIWMFLAAPLLTEGQYFTVPWNGETWFWPAYELYFSHYGVHVSLLILLLPLGIGWARRQLDVRTRTELSIVSIAALVLVGLNLLIGLRPYGGFAFIPRFLFFALPILLVWTWCPGVIYFCRRSRWWWMPVAASVVVPTAYIGITVNEDRFSPLEYVEWLWRAPEWRREIYHTDWRAASVVDLLAMPDATVAIDSGYDGWVYPLYGAEMSRTVRIILDGDEPYEPGPDVQWVAIDHAFSKVWGHPGFTDMSQASRFIDRGAVRESELRVYRSLLQNPDFKLVYFFPKRFQAVFQRVRPVPAPTNPKPRRIPKTVHESVVPDPTPSGAQH